MHAQEAIQFVENKGQWDATIRYRGEVSNGVFFLQDRGHTILQHSPSDLLRLQAAKHHSDDSFTIRSHAWEVTFLTKEGQEQKTNSILFPEKKIVYL